MPFFKIFSNFVHFCPSFQIFCSFSEKLHQCPSRINPDVNKPLPTNKITIMKNKRTVLHSSTDTDQNFIIVCWYFLRKFRLYQTTGVKKNYFLLPLFFLLLSFCYLVTFYFGHMSFALPIR